MSYISLNTSCLRAWLPWICTSLALGYAAYINWKYNKLKKASKKPMNKDKKLKVHEVDIDELIRNKKLVYCRCWKSSKFPFCDGAHKAYNEANDDQVGPLIASWSELNIPEGRKETGNSSSNGGDASSDPDKEMDIKSIDSESPILPGSNGDSNEENEYDKINDEQLEMLEE